MELFVFLRVGGTRDNMVGKLDGDNMSVPFVSEEDVRRVAPWPPLRDVLRQHGFVAKDLDCKDESSVLYGTVYKHEAL